jgi:hypothetical protein
MSSPMLFLSDWENKFPSAIVHNTTTNASFIRFAALLKHMGVKNHNFCLTLLDPELEFVDPYDPYISQENMLRVAAECYNNVWYYLREIARSPAGTPERPIKFRANRGNMALMWLFFNHITLMLIQIRQTGKSFSTDTLMRYLLNVRCRKADIVLLTKDDDLRMKNLERIKEIETLLPFYLRQSGKGDISNTEELTIKKFGNSYKGYLPNKSEKMALNVGRGLTSEIFQADEFAFLFNIEISLPAALAAGTAKRDIARENDAPYGTILTTTAGKRDDRDGKFAYETMLGAAIWTEAFYDAADEEDLRMLVQKASPANDIMVNCSFNHRQLGYTDDWLRNAIREARATGEAADRDFGNVWTSGGLSSPLSLEQMEILRNSEKDPLFSEICRPYGYITRWQIPEHTVKSTLLSESTVLSLDTSDAVGQDDIGMHIKSVKTGGVIGAGNYNETNLMVFAQWICDMLVDYPKMTLVIERRSSGASIIDYLLMMLPAKGINPFTRIYNKGVQEADEYPERFEEIMDYARTKRPETLTKYKKLFGFATSATGATSRTELYSTTLLNAARLTGNMVGDKKTIDQILGLETKNGRVDHAHGKHDDLVISWLLGHWFITMGKRLAFYGINTREILSLNRINQVENSQQNVYDRIEQDNMRKQLDVLIDQMKKERDEYVAARLENKIRSIAGHIKKDLFAYESVDALMEQIKTERRTSRTQQRFGYGSNR